MKNWLDFLESLDKSSGVNFYYPIITFINATKDSQDIFIKRQGYKLEFYLQHLYSGAIDKILFKDLILDIRDLTEIKVLMIPPDDREVYDNLLRGINDLFIRKLIMILFGRKSSLQKRKSKQLTY